ncbi:hypothetical protein ABHN03_16910 [Paenibacillus sp. NRS-1775]|uniref:hypothetical protein n=1 Tax=unclassified Paenibacillus TaxID=185978 RepID=UPI003D2E0F44
MRRYYFECTHNESLDNEEWETENFVWDKDGSIVADSFEDFIQRFRSKFSSSISDINLCETDSEDSENGTIWASNNVDGMDLKFRVRCEN